MSTMTPILDFKTLQEQGIIPEPPEELDDNGMQELYESGIAFTVVTASFSDTEKYGRKYSFGCTAESRKPFVLTFWTNPVRDPIVQAMLDIVKETPIPGTHLGRVKRGKMDLYLPTGAH